VQSAGRRGGLQRGAVVVAGGIACEARPVGADRDGDVVGELQHLDGAVEGGPVEQLVVNGPKKMSVQCTLDVA
jgi:hypothetical protein